MGTWKKVLVSGSSAALTTVTADTTVTVGSTAFNVVGTGVSNTRLSGSFSGSFSGDGSNLTGVVAAFPSTAVTDLGPTDDFYVNTSAGNRSITLNALLGDIAGNNLLPDPGAGSATTIKVDPQLGATNALTSVNSTVYNIPAGQIAGYIGFVGTASFAATASLAITASYALNSNGGTLTISGSDTTTGTVSLATVPLIFSGSSNITTTVGSADGKIGIKLADNIVLNGDLAVNGGDITTTAAAFNIANSTNGTTAIAIGGNATTTTMQNLTLNGNLQVNGTTTTVTTQNLTVADRFILLGSSSLNQNIDGGIVVQNRFAVNSGKATGSGYALFMDGANVTNASSPRWAVTSSLSELADEATPDEYLVTAKQSSVAPTLPPTYGSASAGYGNMYINSSDESIWIYV
jgi:hypothetical protein